MTINLSVGKQRIYMLYDNNIEVCHIKTNMLVRCKYDTNKPYIVSVVKEKKIYVTLPNYLNVPYAFCLVFLRIE